MGRDLSVIHNRQPSQKKRPAEQIKSKREDIVGRELAAGGITFPPDLTENTPAYVRLKFEKYSREIPFSGGTVSKSLNIYLPLPENFNQVFNIQINSVETGLAGAAFQTETVQQALAESGQSSTTSFIDAVVGQIGKDGSAVTGDVVDMLKRASYRTLRSASERVGGLAGRAMGEIPNPHPTVFFQGMDLRTFTFSWKLVPRSSGEADVVQSVIKNIKKEILPKQDGNILKYPSFVTPSIVGNDKLGTFKRALVSSLDINYAPEGASAFFHDGHPVSIRLAMQFQEVENFTEEDV